MTHVIFHVVSHELQGIVQGAQSGELYVFVSLVRARALHHSRQNLIGLGAEDFRFLMGGPGAIVLSSTTHVQWEQTYDALANESDGLEGGNLEVHVGLLTHELQKGLHEIKPLTNGEFDGGYIGDDLSSVQCRFGGG